MDFWHMKFTILGTNVKFLFSPVSGTPEVFHSHTKLLLYKTVYVQAVKYCRPTCY